MILVVNNADFSTVKIGNIEIPREMLDTTKEILKHYTSVNDKQALALNNFVYEITNDNLINKLTQLCIPALAGNKDEAIMNCLSGECAFKNTEALVFNNKELSVIGDELSTPRLIANPNNDSSLLISHLSLGAYSRKNPGPVKGECIFGSDDFAYFIRMQVANDQFTTMTNSVSINLYSFPMGDENIFWGCNINESEGKALEAAGTYSKEVDYVVTNGTDNTKITDIKFGHYNNTLAATSNWNRTNKTFGLIYSGANFTSAEFYKLKDCIEKLMISLYE